MCIYYKDRKDLHYTKQEHIIPAAIGGSQKLLKEYVSDEFNSDISKLEQDFLRNGIMSMPRTMVGPGKRGSLSPSKATNSKIALITDTEDPEMLAIGYTTVGKTIEIPHLKLNLQTGTVDFSFSPSTLPPQTVINHFIADMKAGNLKLKTVADNKIPIGTVIIGIQGGIEENYDCFVFKNDQTKQSVTKEVLREIGQKLRINAADANAHKYLPRVHGQFTHKHEHLRVYGKTVFNFLAYSKGYDYVMHEQFDEFRNWIAYGKDYTLVTIDSSLKNPLAHLNKKLPEDCHFIYIAPGDNLYAQVYFYGGFAVQMVVCKDIIGKLNTDGLICCWKEKKELSLLEFLAYNIIT